MNGNDIGELSDFGAGYLLHAIPKIVYTALRTIHARVILYSDNKKGNGTYSQAIENLMNQVVTYRSELYSDYEAYLNTVYKEADRVLNKKVKHTKKYVVNGGRKYAVEILPYYELKETAFGRDLFEAHINDRVRFANWDIEDIFSVTKVALMEEIAKGNITDFDSLWYNIRPCYKAINKYINSNRSKSIISAGGKVQSLDEIMVVHELNDAGEICAEHIYSGRNIDIVLNAVNSVDVWNYAEKIIRAGLDKQANAEKTVSVFLDIQRYKKTERELAEKYGVSNVMIHKYSNRANNILANSVEFYDYLTTAIN